MTAAKLRLVKSRYLKHCLSVSHSLDSSRSWTGLCQTFLRYVSLNVYAIPEAPLKEKDDCRRRTIKREMRGEEALNAAPMTRTYHCMIDLSSWGWTL